MKDIIKSRLYQMRRSALGYILCAIMIIGEFAAAFILLDDITLSAEEMSGGVMIMMIGILISQIAALISVFLTFDFFGDDYRKNMIEYDVLSGHSRGASFFGRYITTISSTTVIGIISQLITVLIYSAVHGWGDTLPFGVYLSRLLLFILYLIRINSEIILLLVLIRNYILSYIASGCILIFEYYYNMSTDQPFQKVLFYNQCRAIMTFDCKINTHMNGSVELSFVPGTFTSDMIVIIVSSVVIAVLSTAIAYKIYTKDDM